MTQREEEMMERGGRMVEILEDGEAELFMILLVI